VGLGSTAAEFHVGDASVGLLELQMLPAASVATQRAADGHETRKRFELTATGVLHVDPSVVLMTLPS
jgi:hypothetical protein